VIALVSGAHFHNFTFRGLYKTISAFRVYVSHIFAYSECMCAGQIKASSLEKKWCFRNEHDSWFCL